MGCMNCKTNLCASALDDNNHRYSCGYSIKV